MTSHRRAERGSVMMLMPAGVVIVLLLGAIAFDLSLLFLRQRQASSVAADVANDIATAALDEDVFRSTGDFELDPALATSLGSALVDASDLGAQVVDLQISLSGPDAVEVTLVVAVDYVFARAIPGAADGTTVRATATAQAAVG